MFYKLEKVSGKDKYLVYDIFRKMYLTGYYHKCYYFSDDPEKKREFSYKTAVKHVTNLRKYYPFG